ncbi:MAG: hypothetical protein ACJ786_41055 [Catenulispora sp.]
MARAKLPLSVRVFVSDACGLVLDRDHNAARNLAALAAHTTRSTKSRTGTGVAGDLDPPVVRSKPRGADRKTRITRPRLMAGTGRAGGNEAPPATAAAATVAEARKLLRLGARGPGTGDEFGVIVQPFVARHCGASSAGRRTSLRSASMWQRG